MRKKKVVLNTDNIKLHHFYAVLLFQLYLNRDSLLISNSKKAVYHTCQHSRRLRESPAILTLEQPPARNYQISQNLPQFNLCKLKDPPKSNLMDIFMFRIIGRENESGNIAPFASVLQTLSLCCPTMAWMALEEMLGSSGAMGVWGCDPHGLKIVNSLGRFEIFSCLLFYYYGLN